MSYDEFEKNEDGEAREDMAENSAESTEAEPAQFDPMESGAEPRSFLRRARPVQPYDVEDGPGWSEPVYEPASGIDRDAYTPGQYAYGAQSVRDDQSDGEHKDKKKRSHWFLKAACLVVVCALTAGLASWAVVDYMVDHKVGGIGDKSVVVMGSSLSSVVDSLPKDEPGSSAGSVLTGSQIHALGCEQVVGVNTSFTTNVFGISTPRAVSGSGFIISDDGYIITNYHVISYAVVYDGDLTVLMHDGSTHEATVVGYLESNDIAVIKIEAEGLKPVALGDSDKILVGETVYAIGNPLGELEYTITDGIVSAQDRMITTKDEITNAKTSINMFQITAAVNAGNSGGPVYNSRGEVIGVVTAKYADEGIEGLGFAIPINDAVSIAKQIIEKGYVAGAGLGITGRDITYFFNEIAMETYKIPHGVYIETVKEGSAAEKAGIKPGDIITALGGKDTASMESLQIALQHYAPGETQSITIYRMGEQVTSGGQSIELEITFDERNTDSSSNQQTDQSSGGFNWPFGGR